MDATISTRTKGILKKYGLHLKKSLGQHFLTDSMILDEIVHAADLDQHTAVLEVGPGIGALTERLAAAAGRVIAVELDQRLPPVLRELFADQKQVTIVHGDILKIDLKQMLDQYFNSFDVKNVVANLPYYITTPILMRLLEEKHPFHHIVIMIQKEVAERLTAKPGTKSYGAITVSAQYFASIEWITHVPARAFVPPPQVDSAVIRLTVHKTPPVHVADEALLFRIVRGAFGQRRKTINNALGASFAHIDKEMITRLLTQAGIDPNRRGETCSLEEFATLANEFVSLSDI